MTQTPDPAELKGFNARVVEEFRANGGKVGGPFEGADLLLLTTTGAKSGQPRVSPLAYQRVDGRMLIIGSYRGADIDPAWVHNLRANPQARVEVGTDAYDDGAHRLYVAAESGTLTTLDVRNRKLDVTGSGHLADWAHVVAVDPNTHRSFYPVPAGSNADPTLLEREPT